MNEGATTTTVAVHSTSAWGVREGLRGVVRVAEKKRGEKKKEVSK